MCAVLTTALLFSLALSSLGVEDLTYYYADISPQMYNDIEVTFTQFFGDTNNWNGISVSKSFDINDGEVVYSPEYNDYRYTVYPFKTEWYFDLDSDGLPNYANAGGQGLINVRLPFRSSSGELFDVAKLNENNYVVKMFLGFNLNITNVNERACTVKLNLSDGSVVTLLKQGINDVSVGYFQFLIDTNIQASQIDSFEFEFKYNGLPQKTQMFDFTLVNQSYLAVSDISKVQQGVIDSNNSQIDNVQNQVGSLVGELDTPKPSDNDVNSALNSIDIGAVNSLGSLVGANSSSHRNFQRFILAISVSVLGVAFIGYVLHGKRG